MFKKLLLALLTFTMLHAVPAIAAGPIDINKADRASLESIAGIGPAMAERILAERQKGGPFKGWSDVEHRVKGIGNALSVRLSGAGLTVNGESKTADSKVEMKKASGQIDSGKPPSKP